jgi:hypothetical protein
MGSGQTGSAKAMAFDLAAAQCGVNTQARALEQVIEITVALDETAVDP